MTMNLMSSLSIEDPDLPRLRTKLTTYDRDGGMSIVDLHGFQNPLIKSGWIAE